jgi:uracil-DNA glycosylase family 4
VAPPGADRRPRALPGPHRECRLCPRLAAFREANRKAFPGWHNGPVASFAPEDGSAGNGVRLLIVGLAPGLKGANRTGRPFTGDYAGEVLYPTLLKFGLAAGTYGARPDDGLRLLGCRITNAVRCVPPGNKPLGSEINACRQFLEAEIAALPDLEIILALGAVAHGAAAATLGLRPSRAPFRHGAFYERPGAVTLADSYHCSRYNLNTGRLTEEMFESVLAEVRRRLDAAR